MNIENMTDEQKSVMLAKLMRWRAIYYDGKVKHSREVVHVADISYEHWMLRLTKGEYLPDYCKPQGIREAFPHVWFDHFSNEDEALKVICPNLYDPANMALAWRVLNRAVRCEGEIDDKKSRVNFYGFVNFGHLCREKIAKDLYLFMPPEQAQRLWLDKILSLAIEAGMVGETS